MCCYGGMRCDSVFIMDQMAYTGGEMMHTKHDVSFLMMRRQTMTFCFGGSSYHIRHEYTFLIRSPPGFGSPKRRNWRWHVVTMVTNTHLFCCNQAFPLHSALSTLFSIYNVLVCSPLIVVTFRQNQWRLAS